jgi:transcriptional regulator with XRE-family HTH domain
MTFGDRVRSNRIKNNMSQKELANILNVTPQTISKWENDLSEPGFQIITEMTNIFKISHDELFVGSTEVLYKGAIYNAKKDTRLKKYYDFFIGFSSFLALAILFTTGYIFTLEVLTWHFKLGAVISSLLLIAVVFVTSLWRNKYNEASIDLIDIYKDRLEFIDDGLTLYVNKIKKIKIAHYNAINGINIYKDTGYLMIITTDNQRIEVRDIAELNDLRHVISKMKSTEKMEENQ